MIAKRVLIIDHYDATLDLLVEVLKNEGYTPLCYFGNSLSAAHIDDADADLLILDLGVGDRVGVLKLLHDLRQRPTTRALPVIVNSTDDRLLADLEEDLSELDCTTLLKPFDLETLISLVSTSLGTGLERGWGSSTEHAS